MKKFIYKIAIICMGLFVVTSCDEEPEPIFDTQNGRSIAGFGNPNEAPRIIYNPAADTENVFSIGVSTLSTSDRAVQLTLDMANTTLDPAFFSVSSLNPVIPAGEFTVEIVITTFGTPSLPGLEDTIALTLDSVEGSEILDDSRSDLTIGVDIACPSVELDAITGDNAEVTGNEILTGGFGAPLSAGGLTRTVLAGPGENQLTIVSGVGFNGSEDLVINVDPNTGSVSYGGAEGVVFFNNGPNPISYTAVTGNVLTCIGQINLEIAAPFGAPFNFNTFSIQF